MLLLAAACVLPSTAMAAEEKVEGEAPSASVSSANQMTTGVARARDRLDSATSTSTLDEARIQILGVRSTAEIFRYIPGMRSESTGGEGFGNISVRGLPIANGGAKFLQIQENGIPTLEFGDIGFATAEQFLRADLNLVGLQTIRGGSASTFASNSPGGIVNLIDKTGTEDGGAIQLTGGLDYDDQRIDFEYGAHINDTLRFHVGGFYRKGEGPRATGFDGFKGGQIKFNITKEFTGGYIRFYGKLLDDQTVPTPYTPVQVSGTNGDPSYSSIANFDVTKDSLFSRYIGSNITLDDQNRPVANPYHDATHSKVKSIGFEANFDVDGWTINDKFRYAKMSGHMIQPYMLSNTSASLPYRSVDYATNIMASFHGTTLSYATGPQAGQVIADPSTLNGNGLLTLQLAWDNKLNSLDNMINDLRASKVWDMGGGELTFTAGYYRSSQDIDIAWLWTSQLSDVVGGGNANLINMSVGSLPITQGGYFGYGPALLGGYRRDRSDVSYDVNAPYGSLNYHIGKLSVGASVRYDFGRARGNLYGTTVPGNAQYITYDMNGDGTISLPERKVGFISYATSALVNYNYDYLSYSLSANYRMADDFSLFARYSKGARANADRIFFSGYINSATGKLNDPAAAFDPVQQAEAGIKYRANNAELYVTGFWAKTGEHNVSLERSYRAYGAELEASYRWGIFSVNGGATWTKAEITADKLDSSTIGNTPKHQADLIFQISPQVDIKKFSVGANVYGTTSSFAGDSNQLKMPGYAIVNAFVQYRPTDSVTLMLNANNLFDVLGLVEVDAEYIPSNGLVTARTVNPRTISASLRFDF
ncbi:Outer membrane receptor proteins, mostly Fe transport [Novosphingobium sp. CF614]|uniref:TonB-dependent receptor domain-containing protein n=1 Tax=Novosphingobium sp. CF614 TaxID=1884364 RepID=UPI0008EBCD08|nr:TonB-dependent receptor [Novosphingobium sp. CF614]SFF91963.1 Outer membrane receptor proteins, mostly Fe transport [Novosphingobium sp. CF614]